MVLVIKTREPPRRRYLGCIAVSNGRRLTAIIDVDGRKLDPNVAYRRARKRLAEVREQHSGYAVLYPVSAMCGEDNRIVYSSKKLRKIPSTRRHEEFHAKVNRQMPSINMRRAACLPLEESIASAIGDSYGLQHNEREIDKVLRRGYLLGLHSMRVIQCIDTGERNGVFGASLSVLYQKARGQNRNITWALDIAANYMFYRECLEVIERFGLKEGEKVLFEALGCAQKYGLPSAWDFLLDALTKRRADELKAEGKVKGTPIIIRTPYASTYSGEYVYL